MSYSCLEKRIKTLGFCCPKAYFHATTSWAHQRVADELMCSRISVRKWRRRVLFCERTSSCFVTASQTLYQQRRPVVSAGTDPARADGWPDALGGQTD